MPPNSFRLSLAPMIDKTEPRFRYLIRQLFPEMHLYTEMIASGAIIHGQCRDFLALDPSEPPVALQLGTHCPEEAYRAVLLARRYAEPSGPGFTEYNLNAGCPSDRVQNRNIGAILMNDAPLVAEILAAMRQALRDSQRSVPGPLPEVTLKQRLGIQQKSRGIDLSSPEQLYAFVERLVPHCDRLIIHARIAILEGLNPKQNREIPPLNYPLVFRLRRDFAPVPVELNGGLKNYQQIAALLPPPSGGDSAGSLDGAMLGRISYEDTWELFRIRQSLRKHGQLAALAKVQKFSEPSVSGAIKGVVNRSELLQRYLVYLEQYPSEQSIPAQVWPLLNLWHGLPEARAWRRLLSPPYPAELGRRNSKAVVSLLRRAIEQMQELELRYPERETEAGGF